MVFNATFNNISVILCGHFIGGGNRRKLLTCRKSLTNWRFIINNKTSTNMITSYRNTVVWKIPSLLSIYFSTILLNIKPEEIYICQRKMNIPKCGNNEQTLFEITILPNQLLLIERHVVFWYNLKLWMPHYGGYVLHSGIPLVDALSSSYADLYTDKKPCPVKRHNTSSILSYPRELKKSKQMIIQSNLLKWPPLLSSTLYYVILILISLHSKFHIN